MNSTIIVALLTALAAVLSPLITAVINNNKEIKIKRLDLFYTEKSKAYHDFSVCSAVYIEEYIIDEDNCPSKNKFVESFNNAYLVADDSTRKAMIALRNYFYGNEMREDTIRNLVFDICKTMGNDLSTYHNNISFLTKIFSFLKKQ